MESLGKGINYNKNERKKKITGDLRSESGSMGPGVPENITVTFLNPTTVKVSWSTAQTLVEKYDVTYKPSDARTGANYSRSLNIVVTNTDKYKKVRNSFYVHASEAARKN
ncbi:hypothetical protein EVAR_51052_1 [Eumeta japonica]|uniref:Fibronectin type-III domain-containing protein n=1 Tax=Eumeta variegata TaxID=151549 RepID=A0A4C1Z929_EUMVA|nr:hypothetical protein EVAR_51052_1 [Eumeta japonica]